MKKILVVISRSWGKRVIHPIVQEIISINPQLEAAGLVHKDTVYGFLQKQSQVPYKHLWLIDELWDKAYNPKHQPVISISEIEKELGINSIWELITTVRSLVYDMRGYPIFKYAKTVPDQIMLKLAKIFFIHIREVWRAFEPDIILIHDFITMYHLMLYHYAKKRNISMLAITDAKVKGYHIEYSVPEVLIPTRIKNIYHQNLANPKNSPNYKNAIDYIKENREKLAIPTSAISERNSLNKLNKQVSKKFFFLPYYFLRSINLFPKEQGPKKKFKHSDHIGPLTLVKNILREYYCLKYFQRIKFYQPKPREKFVYFPLQYEPEAHTMVQAPYFTNQIESIRLTAKALPGDYTLYVKEHPEMYGRRRPGYYKAILGTPNVKFIHYQLSSDELIRRCAAVVTATGTSSFEAALLQKPSIMFGTDIMLMLPHIKQVTDFTKLPAAFQEILQDDFTQEKYEKALLAYVSAIMDTGFKSDYQKLMSGNNAQEIKKCANFLLSIFNQYEK